jgi:leader peptidase (prepilin peptidase)/N-methyltransferase
MGESAALLSSPAAVILAGLFGAIWGSFFNVCIARIPEGQSVVRPGSRCGSCGAPVRARDNVPVLSYFLLRGRCRDCGAPFSARYPVVEALAALIAAALWWKLVAAEPAEVVAVRLARFALYFAFAGVLVVLSFIDLATRRLPDVITLPALPIFFLAAFGAHDVPWLERLIGAGAGYLLFRLIGDFWYYVLKREGLGLGDGKLLAVIGAVLGWRALPFVVFGGSIVGTAIMLPFAILARRQAGQAQNGSQDGSPSTSLRALEIPFGPFLAAAALAYLFAGEALYRYLLQV